MCRRSMPRPPAAWWPSKCADAASLGLSALCVVIEPDGRDRWIERQPFDYRTAPGEQTRDYLRDAGVVGLGGAGLSQPPQAQCRQAGASSIPGPQRRRVRALHHLRRRADARTRRRDPQGRGIMREMLAPGRVLVGIEDNKPEAIAAMQARRGTAGRRRSHRSVVPCRRATRPAAPSS
jgi:electron transport complex protein RnfC